MVSEQRIQLLARLAQSRRAEDAPASSSILSLAAASYGSKPDADSTIPTGFDPAAAVRVALPAGVAGRAVGVVATGERGGPDHGDGGEESRTDTTGLNGLHGPTPVAG